MNNKNQIKIPKEHPILRNVFMCIFCLIIVAPILLSFVSKAVDLKNRQSAVKSEETVGQIIDYTLRTDSKGNTIDFNTTIEYNIDGFNYNKVFTTSYYIAEKGQYVKMYYEKGNPYSADVTKQPTQFDLKAKMNVYSLICMCMILFFTYNAYKDLGKAREREMMWAQSQYIMQNMNGGMQSIPNNNITRQW